MKPIEEIELDSLRKIEANLLEAVKTFEYQMDCYSDLYEKAKKRREAYEAKIKTEINY